MESNENNWNIGEIAVLPWTSIQFKKSGSIYYKHLYTSRYICIRESDVGHRGILVKVLGKISSHNISIVCKAPFCRDDIDELFEGRAISSFQFPTFDQLTEVLDIIRQSTDLKRIFKEASMDFDLDGTFWVSETKRNMFLQNKPQFYDVRTNTIKTSQDNIPRYRLTMVYFHNGKLIY
ncbi:MAG: hypothetical protein IJT75_09340 [Bacteroidaceae bacterium]|nr:hypothetical protein [Bacteroidaceae bacterium]